MTPPLPPLPDIDIRPAIPPDIPDLVGMIDRLCAHHGDTSQLTLARAHTEFFVERRVVALIARTGGAAVGYAVLEAHWRPMHAGPAFDIAHLFVEAPHRKRGIGRSLIAAAQAYAARQNAVRVTVGTAPDNADAVRAYRAMGLKELTVLPGPRFMVGPGA